MELEEEIEALDAAIEFKNDAIANRQQDLRRSMTVVRTSTTTLIASADASVTGNVLAKLRLLSSSELRSLLSRYFERIVDLREEQRKVQSHCAELEVSSRNTLLSFKLIGSVKGAGLKASC